MTGIITDIQHFSLHDGDGIRSTVFLKGCNMRCRWCHNPETLKPDPEEAFYPAKCIHCGHCKTGCPTGARVTIGQVMTPEEVMEEVLRDRDYYTASGGGITVSGGEPYLQADFLTELLKLSKHRGLHTAVETNLSLPWDHIENTLGYLDRVYFDIKLMDRAVHKEWTGIPNDTILNNAEKLISSGASFTARTPLIPGVTDTDDNIRAVAAFLGKHAPGAEYELLNYNMLARSKYEPVHMTYSLPDLRPLRSDRLAGLKQIADREGVRCTVRKG